MLEQVPKCPWDSEIWLSPQNRENALPTNALTTKCAFCYHSDTKVQNMSVARACVDRASVDRQSVVRAPFCPTNRSSRRVDGRFDRSFVRVGRLICLRFGRRSIDSRASIDRSINCPLRGRKFDLVPYCPWNAEIWLSPRNQGDGTTQVWTQWPKAKSGSLRTHLRIDALPWKCAFWYLNDTESTKTFDRARFARCSGSIT